MLGVSPGRAAHQCVALLEGHERHVGFHRQERAESFICAVDDQCLDLAVRLDFKSLAVPDVASIGKRRGVEDRASDDQAGLLLERAVLHVRLSGEHVEPDEECRDGDDNGSSHEPPTVCVDEAADLSDVEHVLPLRVDGASLKTTILL